MDAFYLLYLPLSQPFFQPYGDALSTKFLLYLSKSSLLSNNEQLQNTAAKVAAWILKITIIAPLLTVCAAFDLTWWICKTITVYPAYCAGARQHFSDLLLFITAPIIVTLTAIFNRLPPTPLTPLQIAVRLNDLDTAKSLLANGADPNETAIGSIKTPRLTPLEIASTLGYEEMVKLLVEHPKIQLDNLLTSLWSPLGQAIHGLDEAVRTSQNAKAQTYTNIIKLLLLNGVDPNLRMDPYDNQSEGTNALSRYLARMHFAKNYSIPSRTFPSYDEIVELMLKKNANPNLHNNLTIVIKDNFPEKIITLMIQKAREHSKTPSGKALQADPIVEIDPSSGITPLSQALLHEKPEPFEALRKNGAHVDFALANDIEEVLSVFDDLRTPPNYGLNRIKELNDRKWPSSNTILNAFRWECHNMHNVNAADARLKTERTKARNEVLCSIFEQFVAQVNMPKDLINIIAEY